MTHISRRFCSTAASSVGQTVLDIGLREAARIFPGRIRAAYALGSLGGGGGFSRAVSDVDFAVILDKLEKFDDERAKLLSTTVKDQAVELADRLSFFWMSTTEVGRFPPVDRLDLLESGRLLQGCDCRSEIPRPTTHEIVLASAQMALDKFNVPEVDAEYLDPRPLLQLGQRALTKRVLFPVRFILTAETGRIGRNEAAVEHYLQAPSFPSAAKTLVKSALAWRFSNPNSESNEPLSQVRAGLLPVYSSFVQVFLDWLKEQQNHPEAAALCLKYDHWRRRLGTFHYFPRNKCTC